MTTNTWNDESLRTVVTKPDGSKVTTTYDGDGQIYQQQTPTDTNKLAHNKGGRLMEFNADGTTKIVYTQGPDGRAISQKENQ